MVEGSSPELLGFSRVPDGGASGSVATGIPARASAVGIVPKPAGKRGRGHDFFGGAQFLRKLGRLYEYSYLGPVLYMNIHIAHETKVFVTLREKKEASSYYEYSYTIAILTMRDTH